MEQKNDIEDPDKTHQVDDPPPPSDPVEPTSSFDAIAAGRVLSIATMADAATASHDTIADVLRQSIIAGCGGDAEAANNVQLRAVYGIRHSPLIMALVSMNDDDYMISQLGSGKIERPWRDYLSTSSNRFLESRVTSEPLNTLWL